MDNKRIIAELLAESMTMVELNDELARLVQATEMIINVGKLETDRDVMTVVDLIRKMANSRKKFTRKVLYYKLGGILAREYIAI